MNVLNMMNRRTFKTLDLKCRFCGKKEARKHINNHAFLQCSCSWTIVPNHVKTMDELLRFYCQLNVRKPFKIKMDAEEKSLSLHDIIDPMRIDKADKTIVYFKIYDVNKALEEQE
jgi:hypothetical protein